MLPASEKLIVALDVPDAATALGYVQAIGESVNFYKVGMQLYFAEGNALIAELLKRKKKIFLDLKINDIPETVGKAVASVSKLCVDYLTLFTQPPQIQVARETLKACGSSMKLLNVTVLTSDASDFAAVSARAKLSLEAGAHGLICSGMETAELRRHYGDEAILVNPGIRPGGAASHDQKRVVTPRMAIEAGATNIVVGRPITEAPDAAQAAQAILREIYSVQS